jgi:hypothetical protein
VGEGAAQDSVVCVGKLRHQRRLAGGVAVTDEAYGGLQSCEESPIAIARGPSREVPESREQARHALATGCRLPGRALARLHAGPQVSGDTVEHGAPFGPADRQRCGVGGFEEQRPQQRR